MTTVTTQDYASSRTAHSTTPVRRPYRGSCHCGLTKYIAFISLPPHLITANPPSATSTVRIRKCNCSSCHKMSFFHVRLMDSPNDFLLLSPLSLTDGGLSDYTCFEAQIHWYFCSKCGVRCFAFFGEGGIREVEVDGKMEKVWTAKTEGWKESDTGYLTVNAATLEPGQEGLNLKEWTEKGWISYLDCKNEVAENRLGEPHEGGMY